MRTKRTLLSAIGTLAFAVATTVTASAQGTTMKWTVDGEKREALVFLPNVAGVRHPLVFAFHGHGGGIVASWLRATFKSFSCWPNARLR